MVRIRPTGFTTDNQKIDAVVASSLARLVRGLAGVKTYRASLGKTSLGSPGWGTGIRRTLTCAAYSVIRPRKSYVYRAFVLTFAV